jgi:hypothetical protein
VSDIHHFAFKSEYPNLSLRLITEGELRAAGYEIPEKVT